MCLAVAVAVRAKLGAGPLDYASVPAIEYWIWEQDILVWATVPDGIHVDLVWGRLSWESPHHMLACIRVRTEYRPCCVGL